MRKKNKKSVTENLTGAIQVKSSLRSIPFEKVLKETKKRVAKRIKKGEFEE